MKSREALLKFKRFQVEEKRRRVSQIEAMIAEFGKPDLVFRMKQQSVEGDYAYILWTAETADNVYELGTDTFVVRNGQIVAQSFAGKITPKG